ncbi:MAG: hypothetical protein AAGA15_06440 [Pseudomonadota bacterium]
MSGLAGIWVRAAPVAGLPARVEITRQGESDFALTMDGEGSVRARSVMLFQTGDGGWARLKNARLYASLDDAGRLTLEVKRGRLLRRAEVTRAVYERQEGAP